MRPRYFLLLIIVVITVCYLMQKKEGWYPWEDGKTDATVTINLDSKYENNLKIKPLVEFIRNNLTKQRFSPFVLNVLDRNHTPRSPNTKRKVFDMSCCKDNNKSGGCDNVNLIPDFQHMDKLNTNWYEKIQQIARNQGSPRKLKLTWRGNANNNPIRKKFIDYISRLSPNERDSFDVEDVNRENNEFALTPEEYYTEYQNVLVLEGIGAAFRVPVHLATAQTVVLKEDCIQWYNKFLSPWKNYIPLKSDFSNLTDIITFLKEKPEEAKQIGLEGQKVFEQYLNAKGTAKFLSHIL